MPPKLTSMKQPMTRGEFEERLYLTREQIHTGKLHSQGLESMLEVRLLPNGRIDMLSVNELVRLNANMTHQMIASPMGDMLRKMTDDADGGRDEGSEDSECES